MEPEGSLTFSQEPSTYPCPDPVKSSPCNPSHSQIIPFNIVLPFPPCSSKRSLSFMLPAKFLYALTSPIRAKYPAHLILDLIIRIFGEEYRSWSSSPCIPLHSQWYLLLSTLFSNALSLCSSLRRQNYNTLCFSLYICGQRTGRQKIRNRTLAGIPWVHSAPNFSKIIAST